MEFISCTCPNCGANLEIENGIDTFYCQHCGYKIILEGQSKESIRAKLRLKEMDHSERILDKEHAQERYRMDVASKERDKDRKSEERKTNLPMILVIAMFAMIMVICGIGVMSDRNKATKETERLEALVESVQSDIDAGNYEQALVTAQSIQYNSSYSSDKDVKKQWENTRKELIKQIEAEQEKAILENSVPSPYSSQKVKGTHYLDAEKAFEEAGFSDIQTVELNEKPGLFDKEGDVKEVSIDGSKKYKEGDLFLKDVKVIIYYFPAKE